MTNFCSHFHHFHLKNLDFSSYIQDSLFFFAGKLLGQDCHSKLLVYLKPGLVLHCLSDAGI